MLAIVVATLVAVLIVAAAAVAWQIRRANKSSGSGRRAEADSTRAPVAPAGEPPAAQGRADQTATHRALGGTAKPPTASDTARHRTLGDTARHRALGDTAKHRTLTDTAKHRGLSETARLRALTDTARHKTLSDTATHRALDRTSTRSYPVLALPEDQMPAPEPLQSSEIFAKLHELALGDSRSRPMLASGHEAVVAATIEALHNVPGQQRYAPRRPNMLPRLLGATNDERVSVRELTSIIAQDPSLVGALLKIANSSYYRITPEPVESVDRAVVLLGTDGIRSLITAALMQPIFRVRGGDFPRFPEIAWEHTFRSANASVPYNFLAEDSDPHAAELLALVMGLAGIVIFRVAMDEYARNPKLRPDAGIMASLLDSQSADVAHQIGKSWELSEQTLAGLEGQGTMATHFPTALGRSLYFGRVVGALAVLRLNRVIDEDVARLSIPQTQIDESQIERMWTRLATEKH